MQNNQNSTKKRKHLVKRLGRAIRTEAWQWSVLNLAWTAGPVTYLALQGGYYLGYGKLATPEVFFYFAGYTLITGVLAIGTQLVRGVFIIPKQESDARCLLAATDQLFLVYFATRNAYLKTHPPEDQALVAAWWSCRSASTDVDVLEETIRDVSNNDTLALAMKRIEFYRRQGFVDLMQAEGAKHQEEIDTLYHELAPKFPGLAEHIRERFIGNPPSVGRGQERITGFIERLNMAHKQEHTNLVTADDTLAMILLTLELLLGREIIALYPKFEHHRNLEQARRRFDRSLAYFKLIVAKRNSVIRAMVEDLSKHSEMALYKTTGATSEQLGHMLTELLPPPTQRLGFRRRYQTIEKLNKRVSAMWERLQS